jgi:hypothetical protein
MAPPKALTHLLPLMLNIENYAFGFQKILATIISTKPYAGTLYEGNLGFAKGCHSCKRVVMIFAKMH